MITFKGANEFAKMAKAGRVVAEIHERLRTAARPGTRLIDLDATAAEIITRRNAVPLWQQCRKIRIRPPGGHNIL